MSYQRGTLAGKATDGRSVSGGVIICGGACVCWFSRTQKCVTLSTSEAEYVALGNAVKKLLFLRHVWRFMLPGKGRPCFPIFDDNQGAVQLSQNPVSNANSKHIDVRHHLLRELVRQGDISKALHGRLAGRFKPPLAGRCNDFAPSRQKICHRQKQPSRPGPRKKKTLPRPVPSK